MFGDVVTAGDTLLISGFSIFVVFLVLLLLSFMIDFFAYCFKVREKKRDSSGQAGKPQTGKMPETKAMAPEAGGSFAAARDESRTGAAVDGNAAVLAAAAIAAYLLVEPDEIVVKRITKVEDNDSAWARNARLESMQ